MASEKQFGDPVAEQFIKSQGTFPKHETISGRCVRLVPLQPDNADQLFQVIGGAHNASLFDYMHYGPFTEFEPFNEMIISFSKAEDPQFYTIIDAKTGRSVGYISFLHIDATNRLIEIGHVMFAHELQKTIAATEAMYLMARKAFDSSFRRLEWRCNAFNSPSRRAALRLGYTFDGTLRQHMIVKGKNRDSALFSILDKEWPICQMALESWMGESNFNADGQQKKSLASLRKELAE